MLIVLATAVLWLAEAYNKLNVCLHCVLCAGPQPCHYWCCTFNKLWGHPLAYALYGNRLGHSWTFIAMLQCMLLTNGAQQKWLPDVYSRLQLWITRAIHDVYSTTFNQMQGQQPGHADPFWAFHLSEYFLLCLFKRWSSELQTQFWASLYIQATQRDSNACHRRLKWAKTWSRLLIESHIMMHLQTFQGREDCQAATQTDAGSCHQRLEWTWR